MTSWRLSSDRGAHRTSGRGTHRTSGLGAHRAHRTSPGPSTPDELRFGIDRLLQNVSHGRFERSLCALTAAGALVTGMEVWLEHDRASFGNAMMWLPVGLTPVVAAGALAGVASRRAAKTALPLASALLILNSLQGLYLHLRGVGQRPGGWHMARYNMEMGPPAFAPLLFALVGGMGLVAAVLRRER